MGYAFPVLLRTHRTRQRLTQEALAETVGVSARSIVAIERGRPPRPHTLTRLAAALELAGDDRDEFIAAGRELYWTSRTGQEPQALSATVRVRPAQLPPDNDLFTGRGAELKALNALLRHGRTGSPPALALLVGTAGVGKTMLAIRWAHTIADCYPDGQLYANLRGFDPVDGPLDPHTVLRDFLTALDVPPRQIPVDLDARVGLFRSMLANRRLLILLDNARAADDVRPLLPGSASCHTIVTSRNQLASLVVTEGARPVPLGLLTAAQSRRLLVRRLGRARIDREPETVNSIITGCSGLPLALAIVAAKLAIQPGIELSDVAKDLRDLGGLAAMTDESRHTDLRTIFSSSYRTLDPDTARLFRLLGLKPGLDASATAIASLAGIAVDKVRSQLATLVRAHLITQERHGFTMHDLLRAYAAELADAEDSDSDRHAALLRILEHYGRTATLATRLLYPFRRVDTSTEDPLITEEPLSQPAEAAGWLATQNHNLAAAITAARQCGNFSLASRLSASLGEHLFRCGHRQDSLETFQIGIEAAQATTDMRAEADFRRWQARAEGSLGHHNAALVSLKHAVDLYLQLDDTYGQATAHRSLAQVHEEHGDYESALVHARLALDLFRQSGNRTGEAAGLNLVGWYHALMGSHEAAIQWCAAAVSRFRDLGNDHGKAAALDSLGFAQHHLSDWDAAIASYTQALRLCRRTAHRDLEVEVLQHLADTHLAAGQSLPARHALELALAILRRQQHPDAHKVAARLDMIA